MSASTRVSVFFVALTGAVLGTACQESRSPASSTAAADQATFSPDVRMDKRAVALRAPAGAVGGAVSDSAAPAVSTVGSDAAQAVTGNQQSPIATPQEISPGSMLVRTGQASLQVDSLEIGIARVRDVARRTGAVIANTSMEGGRDQTRAASLQLRVPSEHFDEAVSGLAPIGKLESVNVAVEDVGEEYIDVQARMVNARRLEQRLIELLANRTGKLSDVLTVERELARVREEIERYEGRMRYLRTRASVSTLSIAVHEPYPIVAERPGARPLRDAFIQAWRNFIGVTAGIIASLGVLVPIGVIVGALVVLVRRVIAPRALRILKTPTTEGV